MPKDHLSETTPAAWLSLVLDEGQPGWAEGKLVHLQGQMRILTSGGTIITINGMDVGATMTVPLRCAMPTTDLSSHEGKQVVVIGTLRDRGLVVEAREDVVVRLPSGSAPAIDEERPTVTFSGRTANPSIGRRLSEESALMEEGTLLDLWTDHRTGRHVALATDTQAVRAILARYFGDSLDIVQSRWSRDYLDQILGVLDDDLVQSSGHEIGPDNQMQAAVTLLHLPTYLARRLARFSADALALKVLVKPYPLA